MNTKRFIPVALIAAAGLSLAACSSGSSAPAVKPTPKPVAQATVNPEQQFLNDLANSGNADISAAAPGVLKALGNGACVDFVNGYSVGGVELDGSDAVASYPQSGLNNGADIDLIIATAVKDLCPKFQPEVQQYNANVSASQSDPDSIANSQ